MKTLIIAPHADDESISCAGLIQTRIAAGGDVHVVVVHGRVYDYGRDKVEHTRMREEDDFLVAKGILGYQRHILHNMLEGEPHRLGYYRLLEIVENALKETAFDEIVIPGAHHRNQDHVHLAGICGIATRPFNIGTIKRVLEFLPLDGTVHIPNYFIPLSKEQMEVKLNSIAAYRRETRTTGPRAEQNVMAQAMVWGAYCGHELAEAYKLILQRE